MATNDPSAEGTLGADWGDHLQTPTFQRTSPPVYVMRASGFFTDNTALCSSRIQLEIEKR